MPSSIAKRAMFGVWEGSPIDFSSIYTAFSGQACYFDEFSNWHTYEVSNGQIALAAAMIIPWGKVAKPFKGLVKGESAIYRAAKTGAKIPWGFWDDYAKVTVNGREYAQVGNRLYTHHAVDRMTPSGFGTAAGAKVGDGAGRSISPNFIEDVITTGTRTDVQVNGVTRSIYTSGSVEVVTEGAGRTVITVNPFKN
jgi:hypothetical protein